MVQRKLSLLYLGNDLTPIEVQEAASIVEEILDPEAEMIW